MIPKKAAELAVDVDKNQSGLTQVDQFVSVKPFGQTPHVVVVNSFSEHGQMLLNVSSLESLGQVLLALAARRRPQEEVKKVG